MPHAHGEFAGMNPGKMQSLIDDLKTAQHTIAGFAGEFSAPLAAQGISTATVHQAAHWTADQVSRLSERLRELRDQERTTPNMPDGPVTSTANSGTGAGTVPGGTAPGGTAPGATAPGGTPPAGAGQPGQHGTSPARAGQPGQHGTSPGGAAGGGRGGGNGAAGAGAATAGGYPGGGGPAGAAPYVPAPPPPAHGAAAHASAAHASTAQAAQTARHVSRAVQHGQSLPDRVWHDIERYASEPQFAAAFLAAVGAAGLTALVASIAESKKKDKQAKEAARRQAMLDELTRSAGEPEDPAEPVASPGEAAVPSLSRPRSGDAPLLGDAREPGGQPEPGPKSQDPPELSLITAGSGPEEAPPLGGGS